MSKTTAKVQLETSKERVDVRLWLVGIALFAVVMLASLAIEQGSVTFGILDHQAAGSAEKVHEIQMHWRTEGVRNLAILAVIGDLAWIWIYALGSFLAGKQFSTKRRGILKAIGLGVSIAAIVFALTDYTETIAQFIQLMREMGDDQLAGLAATMQPIKSAAFLVTLFGVLLALGIDRFSRNATARAS